MYFIQFFLSHRLNISPFWYEAPYPPVGVLHQPLFPRMVWMGKIDTCVENVLELPPAREGDVVIGGDTSNNNTLQYPRKRGTNSAALSVWQLLHPSTLCIAVHDHQYTSARLVCASNDSAFFRLSCCSNPRRRDSHILDSLQTCIWPSQNR